MLMQPGITTCPHCHKPLFVNDDIISIMPFVGTEKIVGFMPGLYHYNCFLKTKFRRAYCEIKRNSVHEAFLGLDDEYMKTLRITRQFALVRKHRVKEFSLMFLKEGREITFCDLPALDEFIQLVRNPSSSQKEMRSNGVGMSRIVKGWKIYQRQTSDAFFYFTELDYRKLATYLEIEGDTPIGKTINLFEACKKLKLSPGNNPLPIEKAIGTFRSAEPLLDSPKAQLVLSIELFKNIYVSNTKMSLLGSFLSSVETILARDFVGAES